VREPDEVVQGSIPSSVNLPLSQMQAAMRVPAEEWTIKFGWPKPKPDQELVFYCRSGKRSASAADIARRNGFTKCVFAVRRGRTGTDLLLVCSTTRGRGWIGRQGKGRSMTRPSMLSLVPVEYVNHMPSYTACIFGRCVLAGIKAFCGTESSARRMTRLARRWRDRLPRQSRRVSESLTRIAMSSRRLAYAALTAPAAHLVRAASARARLHLPRAVPPAPAPRRYYATPPPQDKTRSAHAPRACACVRSRISSPLPACAATCPRATTTQSRTARWSTCSSASKTCSTRAASRRTRSTTACVLRPSVCARRSPCAERRADAQPRRARHVCDQQAAAEQANLALVAAQVRRAHLLRPSRRFSASHSGPKRYDFAANRRDWVYLRDGRALGELLDEELRAVLDDESVTLALGPEVQRAAAEHFRVT
jgi:rhodanese-related sulfurtransferase